MKLVRVAGHLIGVAGATITVVLLVGIGLGPHSGAYRTLTVLTGSMSPESPAGSLLVVTPISPAAIRVGDVITFNAPIEGRPVVSHRVVQILEGGEHPVVKTQGDANPAPDLWAARLTGKQAWVVRGSVPKLGAAIHLFRDPTIHNLLLKVVPPLLILVWLVEIWRPSAHAHTAAPA